MSKARDIANILSASTAMATDAEVTSAVSAHNSATDPHGDRANAATLYATKVSPTLTGAIQAGSGTFAKNPYTGDIAFDNGTTDTPGVLFYTANNTNWGIDSESGNLRFVKDLNESGGAVKAYLDNNGNMSASSFRGTAAGSVLKDIMLSKDEFTLVSSTIATSNSNVNFITYNYTPVSSSSYLIISVHISKYMPQGTTNDSWYSSLLVDGSEIAYAWQMVNNSNNGTSGRSGVLFPLSGRYTNSSTAEKQIQVGAKRDSADDSIIIDSASTQTMWLRITEVAR